MHSRRHTTRLPYYRHKTFPTQIFRKLLIVTQRQFFGCVPPFTRTSDAVLGFYHYHADFIWDRHLCSPMRGYVRTSAHGGHHELYSPAHNAMCKRWDTPEIARLKALNNDFQYREIGRIIFYTCGYPLHPKTVRRLWHQSQPAIQEELGVSHLLHELLTRFWDFITTMLISFGIDTCAPL